MQLSTHSLFNIDPLASVISINFDDKINRNFVGPINKVSLLSDKQYAFRSARSTADIIISFLKKLVRD